MPLFLTPLPEGMRSRGFHLVSLPLGRKGSLLISEQDTADASEMSWSVTTWLPEMRPEWPRCEVYIESTGAEQLIELSHPLRARRDLKFASTCELKRLRSSRQARTASALAQVEETQELVARAPERPRGARSLGLSGLEAGVAAAGALRGADSALPGNQGAQERLDWEPFEAGRNASVKRWEQAQPEQAFERCSGQLGLHPPPRCTITVTDEESSDKFKILDIQSLLGS
ncbi:unnamed protein product [Rangifer tarandus platyrhynchus]|uniref:Uncharacterized protein n=1 Tax=Rangifer tarandus platyrhynchus TaxID=3082113 RepID=A0ABN8Y4U0_RANTA|nr:unnamed protein product [Rangifer tarandus platyrhynchus]